MTSPCSSNVLDFCRQALDSYGKQGDRTFEYIGINLRENEIAEQRVYKRRTPQLLEQLRGEMPYAYVLGELMQPYYEKKSISLCDISQSLARGEQTFRVVFKQPKKQDKEEAKNYDLFACLPHSEGYRERLEKNFLKYEEKTSSISPMLHIGVEVDRHCGLRGIKCYMQMRDFAFLQNVDESWKGLPEQYCTRVCEGGYAPIFVGINDYDGQLEEKLYFISKAVGFKNDDILESQKMLARDFGWKIPPRNL